MAEAARRIVTDTRRVAVKAGQIGFVGYVFRPQHSKPITISNAEMFAHHRTHYATHTSALDLAKVAGAECSGATQKRATNRGLHFARRPL